MFATQLLRILQTAPSDVKCETCVCDSAAQDMIMKENQNGTQYDPKILGRDSDPLVVRIQEIYKCSGLKMDTHPSPFEVKGTEVYWNPKFDDDLSKDNQNRNRDLEEEKFQNGPLCRLDSLEDDIDSVSSGSNAKDEVQTRPQHGCAVAGEEFMHSNENESSDFRSPYVAAASDLLGRDKNVLECQRPELIFCYKEVNYHVMKDICVDEGMSANRKRLIDDSEDDQSGNYFPHPLNDTNHSNATGGDELLISNGQAAESLVNTEFIAANQLGSKEESNGILLVQGRPELSSERSLYNYTATGCNPEELIQKDGMNCGATRKTATRASDEESFVDKSLPVQEFGTRSFLRSFLNAFDPAENKIQQLPDQFSSGIAISEGPAEARPKEDVQTSILKYNSEVQTRSITFNFNSLAPVVGDATNGKTKLIKKQLVDSREVINQKNAESDQSLKNDMFPNDFSARSQSQKASSKDMNKDISSNGDQAANSHALQHEDKDPDNGPVVSLRRYDPRESSFSADSFITHSGPITFSGNVSLRSDGSVTSGRSFTFPVLQSEWNCSPVRMTEADRRRFRKHKGWRSGLLCCRF